MKTRVLMFGIVLLLPMQLVLAQIITDEHSEFIDFQSIYQAGLPIQFIIENTSYTGCGSFDAKITDKDGNIIWGEGAYALCESPNNILRTYQIKIGYNEDHLLIINESGTYYIEVEYDNGMKKREFKVRQNTADGTLDRTVYPIPEPEQESFTSTNCGPGTTYQDGICVVNETENSTKISTDHFNCWGGPSCTYNIESPLKQIKSGIPFNEIQCKESLTLITKYDGSPACVKPLTAEKLIQRGWIINEDSESLNKKWGELYLEYQLLKESFSDYPNNMTTIERMAEIDDETMRIATILSEREFTIDVPGMSIRNVTFGDPVDPIPDWEIDPEPNLELSVGEKINFGESFTIHAWLPTYENQNDVQYMVSVLDPEGNQVDSTIWFAKNDFVYRFDTTHPAYNITQSVTYSIQVEKTEELQRTGIIYKSLQLDVIYPIQENQNEK